MLYHIAFWAALAGLAGWYGSKTTQWAALFRGLTLAALATLLAGWGMMTGPMAAKTTLALRDLLLLGVAGLVFSRAPGWRWTTWAALGIAAGAAFWIRLLWAPDMSRVGGAASSSAAPAEANWDPRGEWLVELGVSANITRLRQWAIGKNIHVRSGFGPQRVYETKLDDYFVLNLPDGSEAQWEQWAEELRAQPWVDWLEPNEIIQVAPLTPARTLPELNRQLGINDPEVSRQWALTALDMNSVYQWIEGNKVTPAKKALIAILDTGVDAKHEDLAANFVSTHIAYDGDGKGHGTHCAGIAAAVTNNGKGIAGWTRSNDFVRVTSIQVLQSNGMGTQKTIIDGIIAAADRGADVISMSLGGFSNQSRQRAYEQAVAYAQKRGAIVVAAAGNFNRNAKGFAPANAQGVIAVSALDQNLQRAAFSNYVNEVDMGIAAPGVEIFSTTPGNTYTAYSGTSMAAPFVAGAIGLMKSIKPSLTTREAYELLKRTGKPTSAGASTGVLIQPAAALKAMR
jgi:thermitase